LVPTSGTITASFQNNCNVQASPCKKDGSLLPLSSVVASDPSAIARLPFANGIKISNTVYKGDQDQGAGCATAGEKVTDIIVTPVTYCFVVENTGETYLDSVVVVDAELGLTKTIGRLAPGQKSSFFQIGKIMSDLVNTAIVTGNPVLADGTDIAGDADVTASDPSAVAKLTFSPKVAIDKTVYKGDDSGKSCSTATDYVEDHYGSMVTYCMKVKLLAQVNFFVATSLFTLV
jgi:hypothetical protein